MAVLPKKEVILLVSLLLCFLLVTSQARSMPKEKSNRSSNRNGGDKMISAPAKEVPISKDQLEMMDYSPARKKTPIHN
ncbi:OLC1v1008915C1 [Oldenlandia corymbosa var. corymbosa]|uniref:OLC1v1008915C1 n=1 Tax=Oldenlandia corymbosa var. corymbosa TaxID=529605 RepID=A0AAV1DQ58_OLDCO|nr:OLC1v1008915C1 [Oldenlandia corymbosa var. corymbosa]